MRRTNSKTTNYALLAIVLLIAAVPAVAVGGFSAQGFSAQGFSAQGFSAQGFSAQGFSAQGFSAQGFSAQGFSAQGFSAQGFSAQGVSLMGTDLIGIDFKGTRIASVEMKGLEQTSAIQPHVLTNVPGMSVGPGNYISVGGGSAKKHFAIAHLVDAQGNPAEDLELYVATADKDPATNLFHNYLEQDNEDELYVVYYFHKWSGQWMSLCPYNPATKSASAMAVPEDPADPNKFIFACTATGVASKCARNWGYKPWGDTKVWKYDENANAGLGAWFEAVVPLKDYYPICTIAARAAYCQDDRSYTKNGTLVDLFDTRQIIWPNTIQNPWNELNLDSRIMVAQEYFISQGSSPLKPSLKDSAMQRTRYRELSPAGECADFAFVDRLEHDHIEDGRWASPLTNTPRLQVFSPTYCNHDEDTEGDALPWDCSPCTTQVCKTMPECCGAGLTPGWSAACKTQAATVCETGGVRWPVGKVWPRDIPVTDKSVYPTYLVGPGGAVLRVDGTSGAASSATVSGWACDPEWSGATVSVQIYGGAPRGQVGSVLLGQVRADQALAAPLASEVSAACDGPGRNYAQHGFSFTLPADQAGNVFVYALDEKTPNGPDAPPTLIRNGIVHVPRCAHSEHVAGEMLSPTCSPCAETICNDETHAECCTVEWSDACAAAADACAATNSSAPANSRSFSAVVTGWIEAPASGNYVFESREQPSRLFVNGTAVLDWFETAAGTRSGSITLSAGQRYHLRWDRFQAEPPSGTPGPGLTWQVPGTAGQTPIPSAHLYAIAPGTGTGLTATYYTSPGPGFGGPSTTRPLPDPYIDINKDVAPPGPAPLDLPAGYGPSYSAIWEGEIVPSFTEDYTFYVVGSGNATLYINGAPIPYVTPTSTAPGGCAHDLCTLGDKLDASCNTCVHDICAADPYCCNGGYLSYYSFEPVWDARCIAEVEHYCPGSKCAPPPPPTGVTPQKKTGVLPMKAGVHYPIKLEYNNPSTDKTIRLLWASARQGKQVVPQFALYPKAAVAAGAGAGLNATYFANAMVGNTVTPSLTTPVAAGMVTDFSLAPSIGPAGLPVVAVLAGVVDAASGRPSPPAITSPRYDEEVFVGGSMVVHVTGIGGVTGGWVRVIGGTAGTVDAAVAADGTFDVSVPVSTGSQTFKIVQLTYQPGTACVPPNPCTQSYPVEWPLTVTPAAAPSKPPLILTPTDPTHSPDAVPTSFNVAGRGTAAPVHVQDQGGMSVVSLPDIIPNPDGTFSGQVTLEPGTTADPNKGWHKLVFSQGSAASPPVFISVGIDPPTVEFPRNGAKIDCEATPDPSPHIVARGTIPYPESVFGRLRVFEETGRADLGPIGEKTRIITTQPAPGQPIQWESDIVPGPGRHVLYFFQAPDPPAQATQAEIDAHFRAYARLADTPTSRIVIETKPPRFPIPPGLAGVLGGPRSPGSIANLPGIPGTGPLPVNVENCGPNANPPNPLCAVPRADVNIRVGGRLYTTRANADGAWSFLIPLVPGWNPITFAQVSDSAVGGAWSESCESNEIDIGVRQLGGPVITVPADISVNATGKNGAAVSYDVTALLPTTGVAVPVDCVPASGATFPIGRTAVLCTAVDQATGAIGLGEFAVTVLDGPPVIHGPAGELIAEATSSLGALVDFSDDITAIDAADGPVPIACVPASPALFPLDVSSPIRCEAEDRHHQKTEATFFVRVVDTTPPDLCDLPDIKVGSGASGGAFVIFRTCASDLVDGAVPVTCDRAPGSFFPVGRTKVTCGAVDSHGNKAPPASFIVDVGDSTPPVLKLPGVVSATATSRDGARVKYTVTATDNVDPAPVVKCDPPSGALFRLGKTTVNCKATDAAGNTSTGSFTVKVTVGYGGLLHPIDDDGSSRFLLGLPIGLRFALTGASATICDLTAKLFLAPLDANGNPGSERPAAGLPPGAGNLFYFLPIINQYAMLLDTRPLTAGRWQLRVDLGDGEIHTERITLFRLF